jgi:hypothetical protein
VPSTILLSARIQRQLQYVGPLKSLIIQIMPRGAPNSCVAILLNARSLRSNHAASKMPDQIIGLCF